MTIAELLNRVDNEVTSLFVYSRLTRYIDDRPDYSCAIDDVSPEVASCTVDRFCIDDDGSVYVFSADIIFGGDF